MAVVVDVFPAELLDPDQVEEVIVFIRDMPVEPEDKKRLIVEWCRYVGAVLSEELVKGVGARE